MRIDDRDRPKHAAQHEALARERHAQALDRYRHARRRAIERRILHAAPSLDRKETAELVTV